MRRRNSSASETNLWLSFLFFSLLASAPREDEGLAEDAEDVEDEGNGEEEIFDLDDKGEEWDESEEEPDGDLGEEESAGEDDWDEDIDEEGEFDEDDFDDDLDEDIDLNAFDLDEEED